MDTRLKLGEITVSIVLKDIKNVHLSVHPPHGRVTIAAPSRMSLDAIRVFAISKLDWIKRQQRKMREQDREPPREYLARESHYVWGRRYLLKIVEVDGPCGVELGPSRLLLRVRPGTNAGQCHTVVETWYRQALRRAVPPLIQKWEQSIGVRVNRFFVQRMKTKWGSCNHRAGTIRINTDLAKKPPECLEYIVVHEMLHLLEPTHNSRFIALLDQFMPKWRSHQQTLNRLPVRHEDWEF